ncbi:uncharacterized protein BXZ73DRAFT_103969 [Epithele typhae]|uniref:uncharacterized protein n=1 Tax=Epithele typhae TaxID=378194 RepID=UPI002008BF7D|nr:uncharacterized protein BXZ73DRAFT_103969 [Epithele typhae]KAH9923173.1 hypothetical protein BXZ73DRAFT_103969 [Epithele typhae]
MEAQVRPTALRITPIASYDPKTHLADMRPVVETRSREEEGCFTDEHDDEQCSGDEQDEAESALKLNDEREDTRDNKRPKGKCMASRRPDLEREFVLHVEDPVDDHLGHPSIPERLKKALGMLRRAHPEADLELYYVQDSPGVWGVKCLVCDSDHILLQACYGFTWNLQQHLQSRPHQAQAAALVRGRALALDPIPRVTQDPPRPPAPRRAARLAGPRSWDWQLSDVRVGFVLVQCVVGHCACEGFRARTPSPSTSKDALAVDRPSRFWAPDAWSQLLAPTAVPPHVHNVLKNAKATNISLHYAVTDDDDVHKWSVKCQYCGKYVSLNVSKTEPNKILRNFRDHLTKSHPTLMPRTRRRKRAAAATTPSPRLQRGLMTPPASREVRRTRRSVQTSPSTSRAGPPSRRARAARSVSPRRPSPAAVVDPLTQFCGEFALNEDEEAQLREVGIVDERKIREFGRASRGDARMRLLAALEEVGMSRAARLLVETGLVERAAGAP